jgi:hypothetical protein
MPDRIQRRDAFLGLRILILAFAVGAALGWPTHADAACPNEAFRTGASAALPDCRAYELVSPADTDGRLLIGPMTALTFDQFPIELISPDGASVLYMTYGTPIPGITDPAGTFDLYQAERSSLGWETTRRITPSGAEAVFPDVGGISKDHQYAFVNVGPLAYTSGGTLSEDGTTDYLANPDGTYELVGVGSLGVERLVQGRYISPGGEHVIFTTGGEWCSHSEECSILKLEPDAPPTGTPTVYDRSVDGPTQVVSLLPGDVTPAAGEAAEYQGSAADGSVVAFKVSGVLYVRVDNASTKQVTASKSTFAGISQDGSYLFYVSEGNIYRFAIASGITEQINASGDGELVNISMDGSHVYFVSPSQLVGTQGSGGEPNLYIWTDDGGAIDYIATVAPSDLVRTSGEAAGYPALTNWTDWAVTPDRTSESGVGPGGNSSRTTPDGNVLVFESRGQLTAYDNDGHTQIYRYDHEAESLKCVSCNPSGSPATADARFQMLKIVKPWSTIHNVSTDGSRVFFETAESLESTDTNDINDIYQWHEPEAGNEASVELISSGKSVEYPPLFPGLGNPPKPNLILGITPQGTDVTFISLDRLLPQGPGGGSPAIYDARIGGGFPEPPAPAICSGSEACQGSQNGSAPALPASGSSTTFGPGNVKPRKRPCRRSHRKKAGGSHKAKKCPSKRKKGTRR